MICWDSSSVESWELGQAYCRTEQCRLNCSVKLILGPEGCEDEETMTEFHFRVNYFFKGHIFWQYCVLLSPSGQSWYGEISAHTHTHTCMHARTHAHTHTHTHTHTQRAVEIMLVSMFSGQSKRENPGRQGWSERAKRKAANKCSHHTTRWNLLAVAENQSRIVSAEAPGLHYGSLWGPVCVWETTIQMWAEACRCWDRIRVFI